MTEKQKMMTGMLYHADDEVLIDERNQAKKLTYQYNLTQTDEKRKRKEILQKLFGKIGKEYHMETPIYFDYGYQTQIGENFFSNFNLTIMDAGGVTIGDHVFLAPNVNIFTVQHPTDVKRRNMGYEWALPVKIGNNVWIGGNVTILPGVTIGDNTTIGAGSVVVKDIPSNVVAVGNPCKVIRTLETLE